ncbi:hypothetical protein Hanom_Chr03g00266731 [Helianthus anomalus]
MDGGRDSLTHRPDNPYNLITSNKVTYTFLNSNYYCFVVSKIKLLRNKVQIVRSHNILHRSYNIIRVV